MRHSVPHHKRPMSVIGLLAALCVLSACTYEHSRRSAQNFLRSAEWVTHHQISRSGEWVLSANTAVCLVQPRQLGQSSTPRGDHQLTEALRSALDQHFAVIPLEQPVADLQAAAHWSGGRGCGVMLVPRLLGMNDQLNSWAELDRDLGVFPERGPGPDQLIVQIAIYDVVAARLLDLATVRSATGWWTIGIRAPQGMFDGAMREYVSRISGRVYAG